MNILCRLGFHKDEKIGYDSLLFLMPINKCVRCGRKWKFACTGDIIIYTEKK